MFAAVTDTSAQVIAASAAAVVVLFIGYLTRFLSRLHKVVQKVENNTNGVMAEKFTTVRDDIRDLKREIDFLKLIIATRSDLTKETTT